MKKVMLIPVAVTWIIWYHTAEGRRTGHHHTVDTFQHDLNQIQRYRDTRSIHENPAHVEVLLHMPREFDSVDRFRTFLGVKSEKHLKLRKEFQNEGFRRRRKRDVSKKDKKDAGLVPDAENIESVSLTVEGGEQPAINGRYIQSSDSEGTFADKLGAAYPETMIELPEPIRGPVYTTYTENFEDDPDDMRKRRNTSANDHDETGSPREKRTYMENGEESRDTTSQSYWKRKKESPTFITGRDGRDQKSNEYTPAQHRTENGKLVTS
jgi:hypothetical protein